MCEIEGGIHKTNVVRTSYTSTTFGDNAADDSTVLGSRLCAKCRSFGAAAVTGEACGGVTSEQH